MKFIGDFHIHSHFSLATSKELSPAYIDYHARLKGISVTGTGDFTHPGWLKELKNQLEPAEEGLFRLKPENRLKTGFHSEDFTRFILTAEISCIYKKAGQVRKVHNLIFAPSFESAEKIQNKLVSYRFNITSDGRPIIGMDSRNLLELCLGCSEEIFFVPAHIWTPWFSVLGSKSGFDSIEECFEDFSRYINAVEMGLSTDPPMNWACSFLDKYTLTANSDAHSPEKLGRNANIFNTSLSYPSIIEAMKSGDPEKFLGTVNFFPQEGKYHYDGHRKCGVCWSPYETLSNDGICPVCGKKVTIGVMNRIAQLADRDKILERPRRHPFYSLIPLKEILSEIEGASSGSQKVEQQYLNIVRKAGSEFNILLHFDIHNVRNAGGELVAEAVKRMRNREVIIREGYDGEYGMVKVFNEGEVKSQNNKVSLFEDPRSLYSSAIRSCPLISFDLAEYRKLSKQKATMSPVSAKSTDLNKNHSDLNREQTLAAEHYTGPAMVIAGPGTGKTKVLTSRIVWLIKEKHVDPVNILAVTFTNKAAGEMKERLSTMYNLQLPKGISVKTFHAFGLEIIRDFGKRAGLPEFSLADQADKEYLLMNLGVEKNRVTEIAEKISRIKQSLIAENEVNDSFISEILTKYNRALRDSLLIDFDDLVTFPSVLFSEDPGFLAENQEKIKWLLIDEFQDINLPQYRLVRSLMPLPDSNIFVIGDPDQAIYGFRGADVRFLSMFREDYPHTMVYTLKKSYRCTDSILRASGNILNPRRDILEGMHKGVKIILSDNATDKSEAEYIARTIENMIGGTGFFSIDSQVTEGSKYEGIESLSDFAVLCRINMLMPAVEKALRDHNIPYQKTGEEPLFKLEPLKTVIDIFRLVLNPANKLLNSRLIKNRIISQQLLNKISAEARGRSTNQILAIIINNTSLQNTEENKIRIDLLLEYAGRFENNQDEFLNQALLASGIDTWTRDKEAVNLMTIHASKGLEFKCVFIIGCEEGLMPFSMYEKRQADPEEEKRLLYVGMTRAEKYLFLTCAKRRVLMGRELSQKRSWFLDLIEKELIERENQEIKKKADKDPGQLSLF